RGRAQGAARALAGAPRQGEGGAGGGGVGRGAAGGQPCKRWVSSVHSSTTSGGNPGRAAGRGLASRGSSTWERPARLVRNSICRLAGWTIQYSIALYSA